MPSSSHPQPMPTPRLATRRVWTTGLVAAVMLAVSNIAAPPVLADVTEQGEAHFITTESLVVSGSPQEVWLALISPGKWWNDAHTWSGNAANMTLVPQAGGCFCERLESADSKDGSALVGSAQHMQVVLAQPGTALRMRGGLGPLQSEPGEGVLTISLKPVDAGTQITFEYIVAGYLRYPIDTIAPAVDGVMTQQLEGLAAFLGGAVSSNQD